MEDSKTFQSWFLVDITPFKMALLNGIKKWSYAFKKHLLDHVIDSLDDLDNFIKGADEGLSRQVVEGDYKGLIKVMEYLAMVKEKQAATDSMFDPLKDVIDLLRNYGVDIPQASMVQLKELPEKWANTKRLSVTAKQQVAPLQGMEIGKLKKRIEDYDKFQNESREKYVQMRFYFYNCKSPYEHLSRANTDIEQLEVQVVQNLNPY